MIHKWGTIEAYFRSIRTSPDFLIMIFCCCHTSNFTRSVLLFCCIEKIVCIIFASEIAVQDILSVTAICFIHCQLQECSLRRGAAYSYRYRYINYKIYIERTVAVLTSRYCNSEVSYRYYSYFNFLYI